MADPVCTKCEVLDRELRAIRELMNERFRAVEISSNVTAKTLETRLEGLNEWRQQNVSERANFVSIAQWATKHEALENEVSRQSRSLDIDIRRLESWQNRVDGVFKFFWFMGAGGTIALGLSLLRLAGVIKN